MSARVQLEAMGLEFDEGGNTIWVHGLGGTLLRIKCSGRIAVNECAAPCAHADLLVEGDITFCVPAAAKSETVGEVRFLDVAKVEKILSTTLELSEDEADDVDPSDPERSKQRLRCTDRSCAWEGDVTYFRGGLFWRAINGELWQRTVDEASCPHCGRTTLTR